MSFETLLEKCETKDGILKVLRATLPANATPTPVQAASIPLFLANKDVAVEACTGSGKTLSYLIPVFEMVMRSRLADERRPHQWGAIILVPTRELANQIERVARPFCEELDLGLRTLIGGGRKSDNDHSGTNQLVREEAQNAPRRHADDWDVVVGTPGRMDDVIANTPSQSLRELQVLVLDEADALLSEEHHIRMTSILSRLPKQRRTGLFSATQTQDVMQMMRAGMRNPACISVKVSSGKTKSADTRNSHRDDGNDDDDDDQTRGSGGKSTSHQRTPLRLTNYYRVCAAREKLYELVEFVKRRENEKIIVFFATCACVDFFGECLLSDLLRETNMAVYHLHGKMGMKKRTKTFEAFAKETGASLLTCTDVVARGIDLPDVDWIVQFDAPKEPNFFVHRVGRTARAGKLGNSLLLLTPNEEPYVEYLMKSVKVPMVEWQTMEEEEDEPSRSTKASELNDRLTKEVVMGDRYALECGTRAFVSFVAHYTEHRLSYIFRVQELDWVDLCRAYLLLRLPKMKELAKYPQILAKLQSEFKEVDNEVVARIKFRDTARQRQREELLSTGNDYNEAKKKKQQRNKQKTSEATTTSQQQNSASRKRARAETDSSGVTTANNNNAKPRKKGKHEQIMEEWERLKVEEKLYKKMKRGKLSKAQYLLGMRQLGGGHDGEMDGDDDDDDDL